MLSRTHGQPATPTTMGKELAVFVYRLERIARAGRGHRVPRQVLAARPARSRRTSSPHPMSTGPTSRASSSSRSASPGTRSPPRSSRTTGRPSSTAAVSHANRVLHNLATDIWTYISLGYFRQIPQAGATGSSTMPHKVNPIRFENAEANLELSSALLDSLAATLVTLAPAARPHRLEHAAQHRRRLRPLAARARQHRSAASARSTSTATLLARRPRRATGRSSARRSRRSSAPRSSPGARRSPTRTRCSRS